MSEFRSIYENLYGKNKVAETCFNELLEIIEKARTTRKESLKKQDKKGNAWYLSEKMVGMMLYIDKFSDNLYQFEEKIDYLRELGITYVHFMPLLQSREGNNDGGYAVSDYLRVDSRFGDMKQFEKIITKLKKNGIGTCIDFVLNHTAKEHKWAQRCKDGDPEYQGFYHMFDDESIPSQYEKTMTQIFPSVAPGNFTYYEDIKKYVMTRFYEFQWDLNYSNPRVFNKIVEVLLTLANKGIDIFRLDAIPYMWKALGTNCMNLPQVHKLLKMMQLIVRNVCPSVIFLGEAIVQPEEIVKYFGNVKGRECQVMYNASMMVLLWNSIATKDVRLMEKSLSIDYGTPDDGVWINYARCHDDIGWGFEQNVLLELQLDPQQHKNFMIKYMEGKFQGSFSEGELYEFDPVTSDARNSGTLASFCGLEQALREKDRYKTELAVKRICLLHAVIISYSGIPLLYSGDEIGQLNYWDYKQNPDEASDSRWLHRGPMDWEKTLSRNDKGTIAGTIFSTLKELITVRKANKEFTSTLKSIPIDTGNQAVFGFQIA